MQKKELSINKTILFNILSVVLIQGIAFFTSPIFSRLLGTSNYGTYSTFNAWSSILVIILPLCVNSTIPMAIKEYDDGQRIDYQKSTLALGIITTAIFSVIIMILSPILSSLMDMSVVMIASLLCTTLLSFIILYGNTVYIYRLQADKNFYIALVNTIITIAVSLVLVLMMSEETNYWGRIIGGIIASLGIAIFIVVDIYKDGGICLKKEYILFCLPLSIPVIFHSLSNIILNQSDRIMINSMSSRSMAGIYSLAYNFAAILTSVYTALNNSWTPFYFKYLSENDMEGLKKRSNNYIMLYSLVTVGFLLVFKEVYSVFADSRYWDGMRIIPVLAIGLFFMFIYSFAINYEFYLKKTKRMALITMSAAVLNIVLNYILIGKYQIIGAAYATAVSYLYEFLVHYIYVRKISNGSYPFRMFFYLKAMFVVAIGIICFYVLESCPIVRWCMAVLVGVYIVCTMIKRKSIF
jgi:O-antigen/teichoic acid export membrane protein